LKSRKKTFATLDNNMKTNTENRKYKRLILGVGQMYVHPVYSAVVAAKAT
jgi:hypothetical protein